MALCMVVVAQASHAATWVVGPNGPEMSLAEALAKAADGDVIAIMPGEYIGQVGSITQRQLTIRGVGKRPVLRAGGKSAENKAILVIKDGDITLENLEFRGARVPDGNGAGVRFEKGKLLVRGCAFFDNENGLLTANFAEAELSVEDSVFGDAPNNRGSLPHLLYAGRIAKLSVTGSRFHEGFEGHLIKSRARQSYIAYNLIADGYEGEASYEIDLPNGGEATLIGNVIGQGPRAQNRTLVSFGAEGNAWPKSSLTMVHNTLLNPGGIPGRFLRVHEDRLPKGAPVLALNNVLAGVGVFSLGVEGTFAGNVHTLGRWLRAPQTYDFALPNDSGDRQAAVDLATHASGRDLRPKFEFALPIGKRALAANAKLVPGALQ